MRLLVLVGAAVLAGLVVGCSPPQPQTVSNPTFQLKPLPPPGSPADAGKAKQPRGEGKKGDGSKATHP